MSSGQTITTQLQLGDVSLTNDRTVFSPPGIYIESGKYPRLRAGVLATPQPSEFLSIYDHPASWAGLNLDAILSMRRSLYYFSLPIDARNMSPQTVVKTLQEIALSVSPVALNVEASTLPPRNLTSRPGSLPSSPDVFTDTFEVISDIEVSRVAEKISEKDIPASEGILNLLDFDYSINQIIRLLSVGLLGKHQSRRILPTINASRVVADTITNHVQEMYSDTQTRENYRIHIARPLGELMVVVTKPGAPSLDYFRMERYQGNTNSTFFSTAKSFGAFDSKTKSYGNAANLAAMEHMWKTKSGMQLTVFHLSAKKRNQMLNTWIPRAGVASALESKGAEFSTYHETRTVLDSLLNPSVDVWTKEFQHLKRKKSHSILSYLEPASVY